jgi:hypothetical protein
MGSNLLTSDFLFVRPSMSRGFARTLDLSGSLDSYNWAGSGDQADASAMFVDWALVGADISKAMQCFRTKPVDRAGNQQLDLIPAV